jgi:hypothetical protein
VGPSSLALHLSRDPPVDVSSGYAGAQHRKEQSSRERSPYDTFVDTCSRTAYLHQGRCIRQPSASKQNCIDVNLPADFVLCYNPPIVKSVRVMITVQIRAADMKRLPVQHAAAGTVAYAAATAAAESSRQACDGALLDLTSFPATLGVSQEKDRGSCKVVLHMPAMHANSFIGWRVHAVRAVSYTVRPGLDLA